MVRSILALGAGFIVITVTMTGANLLTLGLIQPVPTNDWQSMFLLANVTYGFIFKALGGYVTALLCRRHPIVHASVLGGVILLMSLVAFSLPARNPPPFWYPLLSTLGGPGFVVIGGYVGAVQNSRRSAGIAAVSQS